MLLVKKMPIKLHLLDKMASLAKKLQQCPKLIQRYVYALHQNRRFYLRQELSSSIVVSGKKSCPSRGRPGGRASRFRFRTTIRKLLYLHLWNLAHIWPLCSSCAFWGSYCHCIYSFLIIMKNMKKIIFFISGPELLNGYTYIYAWKFVINCVKCPRCAFWGFKGSYKCGKLEILKKIIFFVSGPELLNDWTCMHENLLWNVLNTQDVPCGCLKALTSKENMKFLKTY